MKKTILPQGKLHSSSDINCSEF